MSCDGIFKTVPIRFLGYSAAFGQTLRYNYRQETVTKYEGISQLFTLCHVLCAAIETKSPMETFKCFMWEIIASLTPLILAFLVTKFAWNIINDMNLYSDRMRWLPCILGVISCLAMQASLDQFADDITGQLFAWRCSTLRISRVLSIFLMNISPCSFYICLCSIFVIAKHVKLYTQ